MLWHLHVFAQALSSVVDACSNPPPQTLITEHVQRILFLLESLTSLFSYFVVHTSLSIMLSICSFVCLNLHWGVN